MEYKAFNNQYVYIFPSGEYSIFYNNINGKIAYAKNINMLSQDFYELPNDISIDVNKVEYEQLYLVVSENCNFRCKYCRQIKSSHKRNMSMAEIKQAIDSFLSISQCPKSIVFFGGEPLMNFEGIKYAIDYVRQCGKKLSFSMVVNGSMCTTDIAQYLAQKNVEVIVSIDGPKEVHNKARVYASGEGTYEQVILGYQNLKNAGCTTGLTLVIGPHNEKYFDEIISWAIQLHPHTLGLCLPHGDNGNYAMQVTSFDGIQEKMVHAYSILKNKGIILVQVEQKLRAFVMGESIPYECKACGKRIVACPDGKYGICEGAITQKKLFHDNITLLRKDAMEYKKTSPFLLDSCRSCIAFRICGGSCCYDKIIRYGRVDTSDKYRCGLNIKISELAIRTISKHISLKQDFHVFTPEERKVLWGLLQ